ncbi:condensation domain-containing protein [Streptomyces sp. NPDC006368]|uniref:condensation domain-containing protein n=1 Tax=Streptomyces sp. NPDC006368 TaxID=3156760 RepID=UPI0033B28482
MSVEDTEIRPGEVHEWHLVSLRGDGLPEHPAARRMSGYNQAKHFTVARQAQDANDPIRSYVAGTFDISGTVDVAALEAALLHLVRRHELLRTLYRPLAGDLSCDVLDPGDVALKHVEAGRLDSVDEVRAHLHRTFRTVETLSWPLIVMGAVVRDGSATVYFSCDHLVTDGLSTAIAVNDIASAYEALTGGQPLDLTDVGSYLDFSRAQRRDNRAMSAEDERLDYWREFSARNGGLFPRFPLELGVEPGRLYPPVTRTERLLTGRQVDGLEAECRARGGRLSMGLLAAVAISLREEGGPQVYRGLVPVNERGRGAYAQAMGWFINTLPIEFPVGEGMGFTDVLAGAQEAYAVMRAHSDVHFVKAWRLLAPDEYAKLHYWPHAVNFFSFIDFRRMPGAERHAACNARMHVWVSRCNGILFWLHRTDGGLYLNTIHVDTPRARSTKAGFVRTLVRTVATLPRAEAR